MTTHSRPLPIRMLPTGVPGLDTVLGGGLPEYSFNLIAGGPGCGKTTLSQQIVFSQATDVRPALYFTVLGEPPLKMIRHARQYTFFDDEKVDSAVRFLNLSAEAMHDDLDKLFERIRNEVEAIQPALVVVDSFRTVARNATSEGRLQAFVQRLALFLTSWQATTFLVGEYAASEWDTNPIFTVADGILWLNQATEREACIRRLQVTKLRGCAQLPGLHTFLVSTEGLRIFPRSLGQPRAPRPATGLRASTGVIGLDAMMNGGIPEGESAVVIGPSGSGKSLLVRQFIAKGAEAGERGVIVPFQASARDYLERASGFGPDLRESVDRGAVEILPLGGLDLSVEEALWRVREAVTRLSARRLAVDSLEGFALSLAPSFREDLRESLFRIVSALGGLGVTTLMTGDFCESDTAAERSRTVTELLMDVVVSQRYVEIDGKVEKAMTVVKMRSSFHETSIRRYTIGESGIVVGPLLEVIGASNPRPGPSRQRSALKRRHRT